MLLEALLFLAVCWGHPVESPPEVMFEWQQVDFNFPSEEARQAALDSGDYIPEDNVIFGMKVWKDKIFLTVPRWREGVPATLNVISMSGESTPKLQPYPGWDENKLGDCSALQNVVRTDVDSHDRLWVLDSGRSNVLTEHEQHVCSPKLVIFDLNTDAVLRSFEFSEHIASHTRCWLTNVMVDDRGDPEDVFAYISDPREARLVVYSFKDDDSWTVEHPSFIADPEAIHFHLAGTDFDKKVNLVSTALSPLTEDGTRKLYYCPLSSYDLFSVPTSVLRDPAAAKDISNDVSNVGKRSSQTDTMIISKDGLMFFGLLSESGIAHWDISTPFVSENQEVITKDEEKFQFQSDMSFDEEDNLWFITNKIHKFFDKSLDFGEVNFRLMRIAEHTH